MIASFTAIFVIIALVLANVLIFLAFVAVVLALLKVTLYCPLSRKKKK